MLCNTYGHSVWRRELDLLVAILSTFLSVPYYFNPVSPRKQKDGAYMVTVEQVRRGPCATEALVLTCVISSND